MKIAIIGGGWVGCHLATKLFIQGHEVNIYEKNSKLFLETSFNNQNRLHLGYHYARSHKTRELCRTTFDRFLADYNFLTKPLANNWYGVVQDKSIIDLGTFNDIFNSYSHQIVNKPNLKGVEGCINVSERQIDFESAHEFFNNELSNFHIKKTVCKDELDKLAKRYDFVIDCTNNCLINLKKPECYYELTVSYLYKKIKETPFDALTLVDGSFFSIYPYKNDLYTLTDVEYTPIKKFKEIKQLEKYRTEIDGTSFFDENRSKIVTKVKEYFNDFDKHFEYYSYYLSTKSKIVSGSDNRAPIIIPENNIIHCFTGKIQGIYIIEDFVKKYINNFYDKRTAE